MSLLLPDDQLSSRATIAANQLAPLAHGLAAELAPVYERDLFIPREKAVLSREGGRCPRDGSTLDFDPFSPHRHRCSICGEVYGGEPHYRNWIFRYQLWLAERAVHAALFRVLGIGDQGGVFSSADAGSFSSAVLACYADQYLLYPNVDNVLGPTRPFFSTYLESIWLLNLAIAVDLLEHADPRFRQFGDRIRDRLIEPSAALIASYDEGASNRQVWNDAALIAANRLLGRDDAVERVLYGRSGITYHLENGLLADGTWYEGENYHLFAHRGLWYGVVMAEAAGLGLPPALLARFQEAFATPFLSALPGMTLPSRRDSQYAISLRQSRFAELAELGLARQDGDGDVRLRGVLQRLYGDDVPRRDIGRAESTADVERNLAGTRLSRADLGWRSLLFARPTLPSLDSAPLGSVLLHAQGLAIFRRDAGRVYVALDYGASGGGHGHPDRLNVLLSDRDTRWLDDMGTGSYVDPSLHWYRSTLAHNAPLFNGYEQQRVDGELFAFEERAGVGWVSARAFDLYPGVAAIRTLVVMEDYVVDELAWEGTSRPLVMDLPIHVDPASITIRRFTPDQHLGLYELDAPLEDTLGVVRDSSARWIGARTVARLTARDGDRVLHGFLVSSRTGLLYRATAPGAPGQGRRPFLLLRVATAGETSWVRTVWSWTDAIEKMWVGADSALTVERRDGSHDRHSQTFATYRVERVAGDTQRVIALDGLALRGRERRALAEGVSIVLAELVEGRPTAFELGENDYRRSEETWREAGGPTASIALWYVPNELVIDVIVRKAGNLTFAPASAANPYDNESPDINGDGLQLYIVDDRGDSGWMLVPDIDTDNTVRVRLIDGWRQKRTLNAGWFRIDGGFGMRIRLSLRPAAGGEFRLGIVVNEKPLGRERRRGQLVLGGAVGEFVYLRGDREDPNRLPVFRLVT